MCGISHTLSRPANFIYLFVHERDLLVTWFLSVSREDWVPVFSVYTADCTAAIFLLRFLVVNLYGIYICFPGLFVSKVRISHFPISQVLCCGSPKICPHRLIAITSVRLVCVLSYFVISLGVYNRRFFHTSRRAVCVQCRLHRSCYAFTSQHFSAWTFGKGCARLKGVIVLSKANILRLEFICAGCTETHCHKVSHECLKVSRTERNYCLP